MDFVIFFVAFKPIVTEFWPAERLIRVSLEEKYTSVQTNYLHAKHEYTVYSIFQDD